MRTSEKKRLVSSLLDIAVGQSAETAKQFLRATSWNLDEAIVLFFAGNGAGGGGGDPLASSSSSASASVAAGGNDDDDVRAPLPVVRDTLYGDATRYAAALASSYDEETISKRSVWNDEALDSLYRPPIHLTFKGSFEKAKAAASMENKWLLVNLQSIKEFSSHTLNRDTWSDKTVSETVTANFVFWQAYDDTYDGKKVCTIYELGSVPAVLVIDPFTGQKMQSRFGMVKPEIMLEVLVQFMGLGPKEYRPTLSQYKRSRGGKGSEWGGSRPPKRSRLQVKEEEEEMLVRAIDAASMNAAAEEEEEQPCSTKKTTYPPLPEEPKGSDRSLVCRVGVRLPDRRRVQRSFLRTDPIQLLWSFCHSQLGEAEAAADQSNPLRLILPIPGASTTSLDYYSKLTFQESGLANSMISVARD